MSGPWNPDRSGAETAVLSATVPPAADDRRDVSFPQPDATPAGAVVAERSGVTAGRKPAPLHLLAADLVEDGIEAIVEESYGHPMLRLLAVRYAAHAEKMARLVS